MTTLPPALPPQSGPSTQELMRIALCGRDSLRARDAAAKLAERSLTEDDLRQLAEGVTAADAELRVRAVTVLGNLPQHAERAQVLIEKALKDPVWTVREVAAGALSQLAMVNDVETEGVHAALIGVALHDANEFVRDAACQSLALLAQRRHLSLEPLRQALVDRRPPVRWRAAEALVCFPHRTAEFLAELLKVLDDSHFRVRRRAMLAAPRLETQSVAAIPTLIRRCCDADPNLRRAAREALGRTLDYAPEPIRAALARLLVEEGCSESVLRSMLDQADLSPTVRNQFAQICRRRAAWWARRSEQSGLSEGAPAGSLDAVLDALGRSKSNRSAEKESAWLLARLVEAWLRSEA